MSGIEVLRVIGIISNILQVIDFSVNIYERAKNFSQDVNDIPKAFRNTSEVLPLVKSALQQTQARMTEGEVDAETCQALRKVLDGCEATVTKLKDIFHNVLPAKDASKWTRGWKAVSSVGQDKKVEALDKDLMRFVEVLTLYHSSRGLSTAQLTRALSTPTVKVDHAAQKPIFMVRYQKEDYFIGREDIMHEISNRFEQDAPRVAITGIGGVGKSRIAIEYCYQYRARNSASNIFWVHGGSRSRVAAAYYEIAEKLQIPGADKHNINILTFVSDWLSEEENGPWLMVLDNADDADVWVTAPEGPLVNYLPRGKHGSMLVTTRNSQLGKIITKARKKPIDVPIFGSDDSVALLRSKVSEDDELTIEDSKEITSILCHLPLAITQAAAYLDQNEISVAEYLALLKSSKADTVDLVVRESHDESRDPDIQNSVFHTWKISFDQISRQHPRAASVLSTMALLDRQSISMELLREEGDAELDIREAMQKLKAFSLVTEETKDKTFSMHRIVQLSIQWYLKSQESLESWQEKALICVDSYYFESKDLRLIETLLPHIQLVISYNYTTGACKIHLANLLYKIGGYNFGLGRWRLAIQYGEECLKLRETICGPAHKKTIQTMTELAHGLIMSSSRRNHDRAEKLLRRALVLSETDFPDLHIHSLRRLARLLSVQGKLTESEELSQQVLKLVREQDGADSDDAMYTIALIMYESTFVYEAQDRHEEAENVQRKVLEIFKARGDRDTELAICMKRLAQILSFRHKHTEELELRREILSIWTELLGPIHPGTLVERNPLAQCLTNCGELEEAEEILRELLEIRTQTLGADHKDTLKTLRNLARVLNKMDKCDEAEGIQQDALVRCTNALGPEHELTLSIMYDLGKTLFYFDKDDEARDLLRQALRLRIKVSGLEDRKTLSVRSFLERWLEEPSSCSTSAASDSGWALEDEPEEATGNTGEEGVVEAKDSGEQDRSEDVPLDLTNLEITEENSGK